MKGYSVYAVLGGSARYGDREGGYRAGCHERDGSSVRGRYVLQGVKNFALTNQQLTGIPEN
jgi:hypothetical protein